MVYRGPQGLTIYLVRRTFRLLQEKFEHIWFRQESGRVIAKAPNGTLKRHAKIRKLSPVPPGPAGGGGRDQDGAARAHVLSQNMDVSDREKMSYLQRF